MRVESELGRGTTFTLYLPRADWEGLSDATAAARDGAVSEHGRGRRVLVVEDNVEVGQFAAQILKELGYQTTLAGSANKALKLLNEPDGYDVVFTDVIMPGMNGVDLAQEIRRRRPNIPVVLTSGYSEVLDGEGSHGFALIRKPYAAEDLSRVLRRLSQSGPSKSNRTCDGSVGVEPKGATSR